MRRHSTVSFAIADSNIWIWRGIVNRCWSNSSNKHQPNHNTMNSSFIYYLVHDFQSKNHIFRCFSLMWHSKCYKLTLANTTLVRSCKVFLFIVWINLVWRTRSFANEIRTFVHVFQRNVLRYVSMQHRKPV